MDAIFILRRLIEKYREKKKDLHLVFIDLEKAYDRVPRELMWKVLEKKGVPVQYIDVLKDMYEGAITSVRTVGGETRGFPITVGLHQGSALSPYLFTLVMDEVTKCIQDDVPWCMLFADDIVLVDETSTGLNTKLELWRDTLESKGFRISRTKTEYMECNFSGYRASGDEVITIGGQEVPKRENFRYLGSFFRSDGEIDDDVTHRIQAGWMKWRSASGVLCDRRIPAKLKGKFYKTAVRPALMYGSECWAMKKKYNQKMSVAEMRMLRWMSGVTRKDRMRNDTIRKNLNVTPIEDKLRENRLRWFGHVYRRPSNAPVKRIDTIQVVGGRRGRGRPKRTWVETIRHDLAQINLREEMCLNRHNWRRLIHVADPG